MNWDEILKILMATKRDNIDVTGCCRDPPEAEPRCNIYLILASLRCHKKSINPEPSRRSDRLRSVARAKWLAGESNVDVDRKAYQ
jgi:hypothetical protein